MDDFENGKCQGNTANFSFTGIKNSSPNLKGTYFAKADQNGWSLPRNAQQEQFVYPYGTACGKQIRLLLFDVKQIYNFPCRNWEEESPGFKNQQFPSNCPDGRTSKVYFLGGGIFLSKVSSWQHRTVSGIEVNLKFFCDKCRNICLACGILCTILGGTIYTRKCSSGGCVTLALPLLIQATKDLALSLCESLQECWWPSWFNVGCGRPTTPFGYFQHKEEFFCDLEKKASNFQLKKRKMMAFDKKFLQSHFARAFFDLVS